MPHALRIAAAINANAGKHDDESRSMSQAVEPFLLDAFKGNAEVVVYRTKSLGDLDRAVDDATRKLKATVFLTVGGDGTTHQFFSRLIPAYRRAGIELPMIAIAPTGTMNVVPKALGITGDDRFEAFQRTMTQLRLGHLQTVQAHVLRINDRHGFIYGSGLPVNALARYNAYEKRGRLRAAQVVGQIFLQETLTAALPNWKQPSIAEPFAASVTCKDADGDYVFGSGRWTAMLAGTIESIGIGSKPIYRARERPGHFHLIGAEHGFWDFARRGLAVIDGDDLGGKINHPLTAARITYMKEMARFVDGDMYGEAEFGHTDDLACGPLLSFLTP